jgi:hypothetical protein
VEVPEFNPSNNKTKQNKQQQQNLSDMNKRKKNLSATVGWTLK